MHHIFKRKNVPNKKVSTGAVNYEQMCWVSFLILFVPLSRMICIVSTELCCVLNRLIGERMGSEYATTIVPYYSPQYTWFCHMMFYCGYGIGSHRSMWSINPEFWPVPNHNKAQLNDCCIFHQPREGSRTSAVGFTPRSGNIRKAKNV